MHEKISRTVSHASGTIVGSTAEDALEQQKRVDALMANPLMYVVCR